ncbi:hypothetical protein [Luteimonas sp. FCS-9]|uniref:hypothetical protein n=1 Tax=Luteimonas sp. FCS-9 TaxID=1547516 RepID=UPI00063ED0ED|nr:hypothetical protein [Luteimonas sp. FCS-9]KLJ02812.1 hypothetical protein WQ56_00545 [Luteimonas sp. FCS-9]
MRRCRTPRVIDPASAERARRRAQELEQQARDLIAAAHGADWRARARAEEGASHLRREASRYRAQAGPSDWYFD